MEEEKAAAYYEELLGKGRNAALFKQGLGFRTGPTNAPAGKQGVINFVGAGKPGAGRDELDDPRPRSESAGRGGDGQARTRLLEESAEGGGSGSRSRSEERDGRERGDKDGRCRSPPKGKRGRYRSPSRGRPGGISPRDGRHRSRSRSKERNRRDRSGSRSKRSRRCESGERSRSRQERPRSRSRSRDRGRKYHGGRDSRSRSRSRDRGHRYHRDRKSRSRSWSRDRSRRHHRDRSGSRSKESDRRRRNGSRSRSRERSRRDYKESRGRSKSGSPGRRARDRGLDDDRQYRSRADRRQDTSRSSPSRRQKRSARRIERDQDWGKLIPGLDSMTPAEKVKAKMKLQLSQTIVKDTGKGVEEEWERFDFNKDAPLDDDAKQDYFGDGTGASTDTAQIDNLGGSHLFITEQAKREARLQAAHEAAIFGAPVVVEDRDLKRRSNRRERENSDSRGDDDDGYEDDNDTAAAKVSGVVSEQIIALQAGSSWQERIKKMRAAQAQDES